MEKTLCIYDPNNFKGLLLNTMPFVEPNVINSTIVHYTNQTFEEYNKTHGGNLLVVPFDEFYQVMDDFHKSIFSGPFAEISERLYYNSLECLPPCQWHDLNERFNSFYICEATTSHYHGFFIMDTKNNKFYSATRSRFIKDSDLLKELEQLN